MSNNILLYTGIALGGAAILGGLVFLNSPRHQRYNMARQQINYLNDTQQGISTMFKKLKNDPDNLEGNNYSNPNQTQPNNYNYNNSRDSLYGGKSRKRQSIKRSIKGSKKRNISRNKK
jgi:hypothetical protein